MRVCACARVVCARACVCACVSRASVNDIGLGKAKLAQPCVALLLAMLSGPARDVCVCECVRAHARIHSYVCRARCMHSPACACVCPYVLGRAVCRFSPMTQR